MKYLKRIFEGKDFTEKTKKILSDFGVTEEEYLKAISLIDKEGYSTVRHRIPFMLDMFNKDDYNLEGYENARKLFNFYDEIIKKTEDFEKIEDFFLDLKEDSKYGITVKFTNHMMTSSQERILFSFSYENFIDISEKVLLIDNRFKRAGLDYTANFINDHNISDKIPDTPTKFLTFECKIQK